MSSWLKLACAFAVAGAATATLLSIRVPVAYQATARVQPSWRLAGTVVTVDKVDQYAASLGPRLKSTANLEAVIAELRLPYTPSTLASNVTVAADASHQEQIDVTVTDSNPVTASHIANALVTVYNAQAHSRPEVIFFDSQAVPPSAPARPNPPLQALVGALTGLLIVFSLFHVVRKLETVAVEPPSRVGMLARSLVPRTRLGLRRFGLGLALLSGGTLVAGAALAGARSDPTLALAGFLPLLLVAIVVSPLLRLMTVVVGGLLVFQSSQSLTFPKVTYLVVALVVGLISLFRVYELRHEPVFARLRVLLYAAAALAVVLAISLVVARTHGTGAVAWARDAAPYALLCLAALLAVDVSSSSPSRAVVEMMLIGCGVAAALAYANGWLAQRDYGALPLNLPVLQSFVLPAALMAYSTSQVIAGRRLAVWVTIAVLVGFLLFVTGSRATLLIMVGPLSVAIWSGPNRPVATARRIGLALIPAAAAGALTAAFLYASTAAPPGTTANAAPSAEATAASAGTTSPAPPTSLPGSPAPAIASPPALQTRLIAGRFESILSITRDPSFIERLTVDRLAWSTFVHHPVLGVGPGYLFQWPTPASQVKESPYLDSGLSLLAKFGLASVPVIVLLAIALAGVIRDREVAVAPRAALLGYCSIVVAWMAVEAPFEDKGLGFGLAILLVLTLTDTVRKSVVTERVVTTEPGAAERRSAIMTQA